MYKVSFKDVGRNAVTKDVTLQTDDIDIAFEIIANLVMGFMEGRCSDTRREAGNEFVIYYEGTPAGSFTLQQVLG